MGFFVKCMYMSSLDRERASVEESESVGTPAPPKDTRIRFDPQPEPYPDLAEIEPKE